MACVATKNLEVKKVKLDESSPLLVSQARELFKSIIEESDFGDEDSKELDKKYESFSAKCKEYVFW